MSPDTNSDLSITHYKLASNLSELLDPIFKEKYISDIEKIEPKCSMTSNEFIFECVMELVSQTKNGLSLQEIKNNYIKNSRKTKKRWGEKDFKDLDNFSSISNKKGVVKEISYYKPYPSKNLQELFGVNCFEDLIQLKKERILKWSSDKNSFLYEYDFFSCKSFSQKISALKNDILLAIIDIINNIFNGSLEGYLTKRATVLVDNPIFSGKKSALVFYPLEDNVAEDTESVNSKRMFNDYYVTEDYVLRTIIQADSNSLDIQELGSLDEKDSRIIDLIYGKLDPRVFVSERHIEIDLSEIVKKVYKNNSGLNYVDAEKRIYKIAKYSIQGRVKKSGDMKDTTTFYINFFDSAFVLNDPNSKKRYARIKFGTLLYDSYMKNTITKIASYQYSLLSNELAKLLFFSFQKDRIEITVSKKPKENFTLQYSYLTFRHRVRFKSNVQKTNLGLIVKALEDFKAKNILIKDFSLEGDVFNIEFYPLTEREEIDLGLIKDVPIGKNLSLLDYK